MSDDLIERLHNGVPCCDPDAGNGEGSFYIDDANETMTEAADRIEALTAENERLREVLREVFEQWAGSEGFIPETAPEGYLLELTKRMALTARAALADKQ